MTAAAELITYPDYSTSMDIQDAYTPHFKTFLRWQQATGKWDIFNAVPDYFKELNETDYAAGTIRIKRSAVINRLRRQAEGMRIEDKYRLDQFIERLNKAAETKAPKTSTSAVGASKVISESEYHIVLQKARSARQRCFVMFLWQTGCRVAELAGAKLRDCKVEAKTVDIRILGKGNKERHVFITRPLYDRIRETFRGEKYLIETSSGRKYDPDYISKQIKKLTKYAIGRALSANNLRHSFATNMIERTNKIQAVSTYLGHASVSNTLNMYVHQELSAADLFGAEVLL